MKKTILFKLLSLTLALLMLLGALCACKKSDELSADGNGDTETSGDEVVESVDTEINALNILGERDLEGQTVTFFVRTGGNMWDVTSLYADSILSDVVNDAVYDRNERLKEQYNFNIAIVESGSTSYPMKISNLVLAGSCTYDVVNACGYDMTKMATKGVLYDLMQVEGLNLEGEWWNTTLNKQLTVANTLYYTTGDIICEDNMAARCLFFNKTVASDVAKVDPASIYAMAEKGEWTIDKMYELASKCYNDLDQVEGPSEDDRFGFVGQTAASYSFVIASGVTTTKKDANDVPYLSIGQGNDTTVIDTVTNYLNKHDAMNLTSDGLVAKIFKSGRSLFMAEVLGKISSMRKSYDIKFGVLPMPKYSTDQTSYYHYADGNCLNLLCIPTGNSAKLDTVAFVLEAMCIESTGTLNPAFYDKALRGRFAYDVESTGMLDIILDSMYIENANLFKGDGENDMWGVINKQISTAINEGRSVVTVVEEYGGNTPNLISSTVEKFKDISIAQSY